MYVHVYGGGGRYMRAHVLSCDEDNNRMNKRDCETTDCMDPPIMQQREREREWKGITENEKDTVYSWSHNLG